MIEISPILQQLGGTLLDCNRWNFCPGCRVALVVAVDKLEQQLQLLLPQGDLGAMGDCILNTS
ncbi:hypothetical protein Hamer_G010326 [Homarus americanus]|uniref:Uncharacterized protein n=1 Tax=Homarus americanus TaxID=6706 RepID=A0A8J5JY63_HOMAM|nr:hypothetical protein Hamer_G010326 [Homarus americanus]